MRLFFFILLCLTFTCIKAQDDGCKLRNPDSLLMVLQKSMPFYEYAEFKHVYDEGYPNNGNHFLLYVYSLPKSSKAKLIENIELNKDRILSLEKRFRELVPIGYKVDIEFSQLYKLKVTEGVVQIKVYEDRGMDSELLDSGEMLSYNTPQLSRILNHLNWTDSTLREIERLLKGAGCVGINNIGIQKEISKLTRINFSQGGFTMYSYLIFPRNLTPEKIKKYNNNRYVYTFYKDNIVLEFGVADIGEDCFEKTK